jgi:hypothetical protein
VFSRIFYPRTPKKHPLAAQIFSELTFFAVTTANRGEKIASFTTAAQSSGRTSPAAAFG